MPIKLESFHTQNKRNHSRPPQKDGKGMKKRKWTRWCTDHYRGSLILITLTFKNYFSSFQTLVSATRKEAARKKQFVTVKDRKMMFIFCKPWIRRCHAVRKASSQDCITVEKKVGKKLITTSDKTWNAGSFSLREKQSLDQNKKQFHDVINNCWRLLSVIPALADPQSTPLVLLTPTLAGSAAHPLTRSTPWRKESRCKKVCRAKKTDGRC